MKEEEPIGDNEIYELEDKYLEDEADMFRTLLSAYYLINEHFKENPDHGILAEVTISEDLPAGEKTRINIVPLLTIGLFSLLEHFNKDLNTLGMSGRMLEIKREVWEKYGKGEEGIVETWE